MSSLAISSTLVNDVHWMRHALTLAQRGLGAVEPNPMVGAVILDAAGKLVGEGWHQRFGGSHAEVNAFLNTGDRTCGGTLFVTLEPCCHFGKTPPCTEAVLRSRVKRVVVAMADPYPKVAGGGIALLRNAGVDVQVGVCEAEARRLNAPYLKRLRTGQPWVIAKWAMSLDGKIATHTGNSRWISGEESRNRVHELRGRVDAVIVGRGTVIADDPLLTARPSGPRLATRVILSATGELPERCQLRATAMEIPVLIFTAAGNEARLAGWQADGAELCAVSSTDNGLSVEEILNELGRRAMTNILVEGGSGVLGSFFDANAVDEAWVFVAPMILGGNGAFSPVGGIGADRISSALRGAQCEAETKGADVWIRARFRTP